MNLAKASELLKTDNKDPGEVEISDFIVAERIGYEAIDRILKERELLNDPGWGHLPSETS